jgi:hypothetical protein
MTYKKDVNNSVGNQQSFVISFMHRPQADLVQRRICEVSRVIALPPMSEFDVQNGVIYVEIEKKININKPSCYVQEKEFMEIVSFPFVHNLGVYFVSDIVDETKQSFILEGIPIEPVQSVELAQKLLLDQMSRSSLLP